MVHESSLNILKDRKVEIKKETVIETEEIEIETEIEIEKGIEIVEMITVEDVDGTVENIVLPTIQNTEFPSLDCQLVVIGKI